MPRALDATPPGERPRRQSVRKAREELAQEQQGIFNELREMIAHERPDPFGWQADEAPSREALLAFLRGAGLDCDPPTLEIATQAWRSVALDMRLVREMKTPCRLTALLGGTAIEDFDINQLTRRKIEEQLGLKECRYVEFTDESGQRSYLFPANLSGLVFSSEDDAATTK